MTKTPNNQIIANNRFRRNLIGSIRTNGGLLESPSLIKQAAKDHFCNLFKESHKTRSSLQGHFPRKLSTARAFSLEKPFDLTEIEAALKECNSSKAPGPDGFNFAFVKKAWSFMKKDVLDFFLEFVR